jgi:hypothetical protein
MRSFFLPCPICLSYRQEVLFPGFHNASGTDRVQIDAFQSIVICRECGAVSRNPIVPDLNAVHYTTGPRSWGDDEDQRRFDERLTYVSKTICDSVDLRPGDLAIDIGGGPGWLSKRLIEMVPGISAILCEPGLENGIFAKSQTPGLVAVPARIDELETADDAFKLVTATGVDYLFINHRNALAKINRMLTNDGVFYIERNVFVEQESYYKQPIFDMEDLFGTNHMMNFWPAREQFIEYLDTIFSVTDRVRYDFGETLGSKCEMFGAFCTKSEAKLQLKPISSYYGKNLEELRSRSIKSSISDLRWLASRGLKHVAVYGDTIEATRLREIIRDNGIFDVVPSESEQFESVRIPDVDAVFVAATLSAGAYIEAIRAKGYTGKIYPGLRNGLTELDAITSEGNRIQMKAFLPAYISGERK